jgi:hypothetical protein
MLFCIVGSGRCGTTLLTRMLNEHPRLHVINETHWIPKLFEFFGLGRATSAEMLAIVEMTNHVNGRPTTPLSPAQRDAVLAMSGEVTVREFVDSLAMSLAEALGKSMWADKTPDYATHMAVIQRIWPRCKFVHMIRNGAHVAQSMANHPGYRLLAARGEISWPALACRMSDMWNSTPPSDIDTFLRIWRLRVDRARTEAQSMAQDTYMEIRYEMIVTEPQAELKRIMSFIDLGGGDDRWLAAAASLIEPERTLARGAHAVTPRTDRRAIALMEELGYRSSLRWGDRS